jgi:N-acetylmuramic acid 6-phosphate etherase
MAFEKITEQDSHHQDLEKKSLRELIEGMQQEDTAAVAALGKVLPEIEALIAQVVKAFEKGGRLFYMGAGTSGRLGVLDASECPPTFGTDPSQVVGLIAGGQKALTTAVEQAEAASGTTPYVVHALKSCQENGIVTGAICCNHNAPLSNYADYPIEVIVGPEFVTGSSRLKAGTVQKLILNRITTCSMIAIGRVQGNKMVDMQLNNDKLHERACQMVITQTGLPHKEAKQLLQKYPSVRQAVAAFRSR